MSSLFLWGGVTLILGLSQFATGLPFELLGGISLVIGWVLLVLGR